MINFWIAISCLLLLALIFLGHYLKLEKGISLGRILFRKKNVVHHVKDTGNFEVTVEEMIPPREKVDTKNAAKAEILLTRAEIFLGKGETRDAEKLLIQAISLDPSAVEAYNKLGLIYLRQELYGKAESIYRKLILTVLNEPAYHGNLGLALYSQRKLEEAKTHYKKAIELDSSRAGRFFSLGQIMRELGELDEAVAHLRKALEMEPRNLDFMLSLAEFYLERDLKGEARQLIGEILLIDPANEMALEMAEKVK